jgi:hypothetical protein
MNWGTSATRSTAKSEVLVVASRAVKQREDSGRKEEGKGASGAGSWKYNTHDSAASARTRCSASTAFSCTSVEAAVLKREKRYASEILSAAAEKEFALRGPLYPTACSRASMGLTKSDSKSAWANH